MNDWQHFILKIKEAEQELGNPDVLWYRGHISSYRLVPSIFRFNKGFDNEKTLFRKYIEFIEISNKNKSDDWEILLNMHQNYIPTRLIDWTKLFEVAVFFAIMKESIESCIYIIDPVELNNVSGFPRIISLKDDITFEYRSIYWDKKPFTPFYPIAVEPPFQNDQISSQNTVFTIHGDNPEPIDSQCPRCLRKVMLHDNAKSGAEEYLLSLNWYI